MRLNYTFLILVVSIVFLGVVGLSYWGISQEKEPQIILIGNPTKMRTSAIAELPTGFGWTSEKDIIIDTESSKGKRALFILQEGITDVDEAIKWAKENDKDEIYFFTTPIYPPDQIAYYDIKSKIIDFLSFTDMNTQLPENFIDFFIPAAFANSVPGPNCTGGTYNTKTNCDVKIISAISGQPVYYVNVCYMFSAKTCYRDAMTTHIARNIAGQSNHSHSGGGSVTSFADCINHHDHGNAGTSYASYPRNFTVKVYASSNDPGMLQDCGQPVAGCAPGAPNPSAFCGSSNCSEPLPQPVLFSIDNKYISVTDATRNSWATIRHEAAHQYGYGHCHMDNDQDRVNHCIQGFTIPPRNGCNINTPQSQPPDHRYY